MNYEIILLFEKFGAVLIKWWTWIQGIILKSCKKLAKQTRAVSKKWIKKLTIMLLVLIELRYADTPTCGMDFFKGESSSGIHRRSCCQKTFFPFFFLVTDAKDIFKKNNNKTSNTKQSGKKGNTNKKGNKIY